MKGRRFSVLEKDFINKLLGSQQAQPGLYSLYEIVRNKMCVNSSCADFTLKFKKDGNDVYDAYVIPDKLINIEDTDSILEIQSSILEIQSYLIQITKLLDYLANENYIIPVDLPGGKKSSFFFDESDRSQLECKVIYDEKVVSALFKYLNVDFIVNSDLHALVERGFKSVEEIRFQENLRIAWLGVLTAMLTSIITLMITCYSSDVKVERLEREVTGLRNEVEGLRNEVDEQQLTLQEVEDED